MGLWSRLRRTVRPGSHNAEIREELEFHLEMDMANGRDSREARIRLGPLVRVEEETRAMGVVEWLDSVLRDAAYGFRQLRKTPALVLAVVLSLALGVGANTAIFNLVDAAILRPLPVKDPDSLRIVEWTNLEFPEGVENINGDFGPISGGRFSGSSVGASLYRRLAERQTAFESLIGIADANSIAIAIDASPAVQVSLQYVSSNFFQGIGALPVIGRPFRPEEDLVGRPPVVIVSHRFSMRYFGGSAEALNRTVRINNVPAQIIGVAPPKFFGLQPGQWTDVWAPIAARVAFRLNRNPDQPAGENDRDWWIRQVGRLKPGVTEAAARTQIAGLFRDLFGSDAVSSDPRNIPELVTSPGRRGFRALNTRDSTALWILMLLVGVLLLIVCVNVANLLLSQSLSRQRESAVRLALGASRSRLFRQHLVESAVLALLGGSAGLAVGYGLAHSIHLLFQTGRDVSQAFDLHLDLRILGYTAGLSILTALLFGLAPALRAARADLGDALKVQTRSVTGGRVRLASLLVSIQMALCLTALVAAGLLGRSLENLKWIDIGFDRTNLAYASVNPWQAGYSAERVGAYAERVRDELARLPGVTRVSIGEVRLLSGNGNALTVNIPGRPGPVQRGVVNESEIAHQNRVGEGFFETLRIPLVAGRTLERRDIRPNTDVVVVDEIFARRFFPNENPLGRRFGFSLDDNSRYQIVGVVKDTRYRSLRDNPFPTVYQPYVPGSLRSALHFAIRANVDSTSLAEAVRRVVVSVDPAVPLTEFHTQTALIDRLLRTERLLSFVSAAFGLVALSLAAVGLGGLLAYTVARRKNEIGVRMALGARPADVIRMVSRDSLWIVGIGVLVGLPCAYAISQVLKSLLFQLEPVDPWTASLSFLTLAAVAILAAWIPARRAARIDPMTALREE